ncbi:MAG: hypothetical protein ABI276_01530 [Acidimicrobiales bacterium]
MASSGLEDLDREVRARRRSAKSGKPVSPAGPWANNRIDAGGKSASPAQPKDAKAPLLGRRNSTTTADQAAHVQRFGMWAALVPGLVLEILGLLIWVAAPDKGMSGATQSFAGYGLGLLAMPTTLLTGFPLFGGAWRVLLTIGSSAVLWIVLGRWATRRAGRDAPPSWRSFAGELGSMAAGVWAGLLVGLLAMYWFLA